MRLSFLPEAVKASLTNLNSNYLTEIRLRRGQPVIIEYKGEYKYINRTGIAKCEGGLIYSEDLDSVILSATNGCVYNYTEQMKNGCFEKRYFAVLCGIPSRKRAVLENYLRKNSVNNTVYVCTQTEEGAKFASLEYEIKEEQSGLSLVDVTLHTGRTHQIRVQTAAINCPVYGDMRYGGEKAVKGKLALWAYSLRFTHPTTGEALKFVIEPPKDENPWKKFNI